MNQPLPSETIAESRLHAIDAAGERRDVSIAIGQPRPGEEDFTCGVRIEGLGEPYCRDMFGVDAFQAIVHALRIVHVHLEVAETHGTTFYFDADDPQPYDWRAGLFSNAWTNVPTQARRNPDGDFK